VVDEQLLIGSPDQCMRDIFLTVVKAALQESEQNLLSTLPRKGVWQMRQVLDTVMYYPFVNV
jgi:hypothetical protein